MKAGMPDEKPASDISENGRSGRSTGEQGTNQIPRVRRKTVLAAPRRHPTNAELTGTEIKIANPPEDRNL